MAEKSSFELLQMFKLFNIFNDDRCNLLNQFYAKYHQVSVTSLDSTYSRVRL